MLNFIENRKILIFFFLIIPLLVNSLFITREENKNRELANLKLNNEIDEQLSFESQYINNHFATENSLKNVLSRDEIIGKKITFNFRERTNNQIGELLKFIDSEKYNAVLTIPIGYQTGEKQSSGIITFDYFKNIDINDEVFKDISADHVLQVKLYNIEGTLVSKGIKIENGVFVNKTECKKTLDSDWERCTEDIINKIKNGYIPQQLINSLLERTSSPNYKVHQVGTKLYFLYLDTKEGRVIYKCEDLIPDGTSGQNFQCVNFVPDNNAVLENNTTLIFDVLENSYTLFSGSGDVLKINNSLENEYLFNSRLETESNLYLFLEEHLNSKIFGHFSSGSLRTYGNLVPFVEIYKPRDEVRPSNGRELSSFGHLNGNEVYGLFPWGEFWVRNVDKEDFYISLVDNTNAGQYVFPFESGLKNMNADIYNKVGYDFLSQRIRSIVPCFDGLCLTVSNKRIGQIDVNEYEQLLNMYPELGQYAKIYYLPGEKQICSYNDSLLKTLEVIIEESQIVLTYQGKTCTIFNPNYFDHIELLSPASLSLGNYIYIGADE